MDDLVSTEWLAEHLHEKDVVAVDATIFMPGSGRDARAEYAAAHIPGARFLDIDALSDHDAATPHMLPPADQFGAAMRELGIGRGDRTIVYDNSPLRSAARGWFMLHYFGAERVAILDGGLGKWREEGRPVEGGDPQPREVRFDAMPRPGDVVAEADVRKGLGVPLIDARGRARFEGSEPDPRAGVASGHVPGSRNLPFATLYNEDGTFKRSEELREAFIAAGADPERPFVASCGSGVTANSLIFAARLLGNRDARLYDGSWAEWGADPDTPKIVGPA